MDAFFHEIFSQVILFLLFLGLAATVSLKRFRATLTSPHSRRALALGAICQFVLLPVVGLAAVKTWRLDPINGSMLLLVTSSPGGAFSNFSCAVFNADLALSISMTTLSTLLAVGMLPLNTYIYVGLLFGHSVPVDYARLLIAVAIVVTATLLGVGVGERFPRHRNKCFIAGTVAGVASVVWSLLASSSGPKAKPIWSRDAVFYGSALSVVVVGLGTTLFLASLLRLHRPQRVAVTIEAFYQNLGIALALAPTLFPDDEDLQIALGMPLIYGALCSAAIAIFGLVAWRLGWTYAPPDAPIREVLIRNYQPAEEDEELGSGVADLAKELTQPVVRL